MNDFWIFLSGAFFGKLIEDNLPDMGFKNLKRIALSATRHTALVLAAFVPYLALKFKLVKQLHPKTELIMGLAALTILLTYFMNNKKGLTAIKAT